MVWMELDCHQELIVEGGEMDVSQKRTRRLEIIYRKLLEGVKIEIYPNAYIHLT